MTGAQSIGDRLRRNRHFPRLCTSCLAPMACQQDTCWRCGTQWTAESETPRVALRLVGPPPPVSTADRLAALRAEARP